MRRLCAAALATALLWTTGCGEDVESRRNVRPPHPGTPGRPADVQGIYRSIRQGLLQLRGDGEFVLIVSEDPGPSAGRYTLEQGRFTVSTDACGTGAGEYRLEVGGQPVAGKATLHFTALRDECEPRRRHLTLDPWVYADS
jgi:hypothetical protein